MEASELEMCVDVKMDTREKHIDYLNVRTWTKFLLKIQPIKCFPCHLRISMIHDHREEVSANMTIRINVPGISVQMASSRKKQHICSLSWTYNQRCTIFLSFDSQQSCEQHVRWLRAAIADLEQFSLELIEAKRLSRSSMIEEVSSHQKAPSLYENIWETRGMRSYGDCQQAARTSGIYEEIPDARRNAPRASIASGIYEEMLPVEEKKSTEAEIDQMPPPLPPRTRINTAQSEILRSFTNPESELMKKKRYRTLFDGFLGLGKRTPKAEKKGKKSSPTSLTDKFLSLDIGKRNSFSSPNLTKLTRSVSESDAMTPLPCGTSLSDDFWCNEAYINTVSSQPETKTPFEATEERSSLRKSSLGSLLQLPDLQGTSVKHIRQNSMDCRIGSSQEMSQSSQESQVEDKSVNGVFNSIYFKFQDDKPREASEDSSASTLSAIPTPTNTEGYLEMGPIGFNREKVRELDRLEALARPDLSGYVEMTGNGFSPEAVQELDRLEAATKHEDNQSDLSTSQEFPKRLNSFDEKIPSYFPNESTIIRKSKRRYQKSPEVTRNTKSLNGVDFQLAKRKPTPRLGSFSRRDTAQKAIIRPTEAPPDPPVAPENRLEVQSIADKCATLSRLNRCSIRADLQSGLRRFASLPRFKKLDLTPLKAKITSALQRQNT